MTIGARKKIKIFDLNMIFFMIIFDRDIRPCLVSKKKGKNFQIFRQIEFYSTSM